MSTRGGRAEGGVPLGWAEGGGGEGRFEGWGKGVGEGQVRGESALWGTWWVHGGLLTGGCMMGC